MEGGGEQSLIICSPPLSGSKGKGEDGGTGNRGIRGGDKNWFILAWAGREDWDRRGKPGLEGKTRMAAKCLGWKGRLGCKGNGWKRNT